MKILLWQLYCFFLIKRAFEQFSWIINEIKPWLLFFHVFYIKPGLNTDFTEIIRAKNKQNKHSVKNLKITHVTQLISLWVLLVFWSMFKPIWIFIEFEISYLKNYTFLEKSPNYRSFSNTSQVRGPWHHEKDVKTQCVRCIRVIEIEKKSTLL